MTPIERSLSGRKAALAGGDGARPAAAREGQADRRERIELLVDEGSFTELDAFVQARPTELVPTGTASWGDGVVTGFGRIEGVRLSLLTGLTSSAARSPRRCREDCKVMTSP